MSDQSDFQKTRGVLLDLLQMTVASARDKETSVELWKIHIDNAIERIELIYNATDLSGEHKTSKRASPAIPKEQP